MTNGTGSDESGLPLHELIRSRMKQHGWSYTDLARRSHDDLTRGRWQQLGSGLPQRKFPDPASLTLIAEALDVDLTTVVLAAAQAVGLDVRPPGSGLAQLLPPGTDRLSPRMRDAILALVRAAVADAEADEPAGVSPADVTLQWPKADAPSRRHPPTENGGIDAG